MVLLSMLEDAGESIPDEVRKAEEPHTLCRVHALSRPGQTHFRTGIRGCVEAAGAAVRWVGERL